MSPIDAAQKIRSRHRLSVRDGVALLLGLIAITSLVSLWIDWHNSQAALRIAKGSVLHLRHDRHITEIEFCHALNQTRLISNRDRHTFERAIRESRRDLKVLKDPILLALVRRGIRAQLDELRIRPFLPLLPCKSLVLNPQGVKIPGL